MAVEERTFRYLTHFKTGADRIETLKATPIRSTTTPRLNGFLSALPCLVPGVDPQLYTLPSSRTPLLVELERELGLPREPYVPPESEDTASKAAAAAEKSVKQEEEPAREEDDLRNPEEKAAEAVAASVVAAATAAGGQAEPVAKTKPEVKTESKTESKADKAASDAARLVLHIGGYLYLQQYGQVFTADKAVLTEAFNIFRRACDAVDFSRGYRHSVEGMSSVALNVAFGDREGAPSLETISSVTQVSVKELKRAHRLLQRLGVIHTSSAYTWGRPRKDQP